jgi:CBS domain-containing protein
LRLASRSGHLSQIEIESSLAADRICDESGLVRSRQVKECSMFSQSVRSVMKRKKFLAAPPETTVTKAGALMAKKNVGAVVIVERGHLIGIFTERDAVFRVIAQGRDPQTTRLAEVMTVSPKTVEPDQTYGYALLVMQENGFRHMPVVEDGKPVGIVSSRNALDPELEEFVSETQRRRHIRRSI